MAVVSQAFPQLNSRTDWEPWYFTLQATTPRVLWASINPLVSEKPGLLVQPTKPTIPNQYRLATATTARELSTDQKSLKLKLSIYKVEYDEWVEQERGLQKVQDFVVRTVPQIYWANWDLIGNVPAILALIATKFLPSTAETCAKLRRTWASLASINTHNVFAWASLWKATYLSMRSLGLADVETPYPHQYFLRSVQPLSPDFGAHHASLAFHPDDRVWSKLTGFESLVDDFIFRYDAVDVSEPIQLAGSVGPVPAALSVLPSGPDPAMMESIVDELVDPGSAHFNPESVPFVPTMPLNIDAPAFSPSFGPTGRMGPAAVSYSAAAGVQSGGDANGRVSFQSARPVRSAVGDGRGSSSDVRANGRSTAGLASEVVANGMNRRRNGDQPVGPVVSDAGNGGFVPDDGNGGFVADDGRDGFVADDGQDEFAADGGQDDSVGAAQDTGFVPDSPDEKACSDQENVGPDGTSRQQFTPACRPVPVIQDPYAGIDNGTAGSGFVPDAGVDESDPWNMNGSGATSTEPPKPTAPAWQRVSNGGSKPPAGRSEPEFGFGRPSRRDVDNEGFTRDRPSGWTLGSDSTRPRYSTDRPAGRGFDMKPTTLPYVPSSSSITPGVTTTINPGSVLNPCVCGVKHRYQECFYLNEYLPIPKSGHVLDERRLNQIRRTLQSNLRLAAEVRGTLLSWKDKRRREGRPVSEPNGLPVAIGRRRRGARKTSRDGWTGPESTLLDESRPGSKCERVESTDEAERTDVNGEKPSGPIGEYVSQPDRDPNDELVNVNGESAA